MIKKIIAVLLMFSMLPVLAYAKEANNEYDYKMETLFGLQILPEAYRDSYSVREKVTYGDYLGAVAGFITEEAPSDLLEFSRRYSLIKYNEEIKLSEYINHNEAIKIMVRAGGYSEQIPNGETSSMYLQEASARDLLKSFPYKEDAILTMDEMTTLLYNAIDAEVVDYNHIQDHIERVARKDETILSRYRDIYEYEGILEDNGQTSLTNPLPAKENHIVVNGELFEVNDIDVVDALGMRVKIFYQDNDGNFVLKLILPEKNKTLEIVTDYVKIDEDFLRLSHYDEETGRSKTVKLDAALKVIYNGELYYDYTAEDFAGENGRLKLIDNNSDGVYEVAILDKFETVVTNYITDYDAKLINKYTYFGALTGLELNNDDDDIIVNYYADGKLIREPSIGEWTVLNIAESKDGGRIKKILVTEARETGILESIDPTEGYCFNGEVYKLNKAFVSAVSANDIMVPELKLNKEYTIFFDAFGKIAALKDADTKGLQYVVITKLRQDEADEEIITLRYMDNVGEWHSKPLRKKVMIYNDTYDGRSFKASEIFEIFTDDSGRITPQVVQMSLDDNGEVNTIKFAVKTNAYNRDKLTVRDSVSGTYRWTTRMLGSSTGPKLYFASKATIFVFPSGVSYDENDYSVQSSFGTDKDYTVIPYNMDEFMTSDCVVIKGTESGTKQDNLFIVEKVTQMSNADDEIKKVIVGQFGDYSGFSVMAKDDSVFDDVKKGDVLILHTDNRSRVLSKDVIFSASKGKQPQMTVDYSGLAAGTVTKVDPSTKSVVIDCGTGKFAFKPLETQYKLTIYLNDAGEKKSEVVDFSEILVGDFIVANIHYATLKDVIIIRNY